VTESSSSSSDHIQSQQQIARSGSSELCSEYANRLDEECAQLVLDIQRIGVDGEPFCTFGDLFDDEGVTDYYEALVGTLKAAKKRNMIHFPGQLLLKGVSDAVTIRLVV